MMATIDNYWHGVIHGLLLALPLVAFWYRKWQQCAAKLAAASDATAPADRADGKPPTLGTFLNELFTYEVVLVAGAEMKAVRDQLQTAEHEGNARRIEALQGRLLDVARVLDQKLQLMLPIVRFLTEQSVSCIRGDGNQDSSVSSTDTDTDANSAGANEDKKDK